MSTVNGASWMQDNLSLLGDRTLERLCITGSHDTGMSVSTSQTAGARDCNTITQSKDVGNQLALGARYLDIRPIIGGGSYYTGHYTQISVFGLGTMQGARGQPIGEIVQQVNEFTASNRELVILNLSHDMDTDVGNESYPSFSQDQWNGLFAELAKLNHLYASASQSALTHTTLNSFIKRAASVIVVVEPSGVSLGDYAGRGFYPYSSLDVYNSYSDTNNLLTMSSDQLSKMKQQRSQGNYFLLSWTLTQDAEQAVLCAAGAKSILDLADQANAALTSALRSGVTPTIYPNIIYIDNIISSEFASLAVWINEQATVPANS